MYETEQLELDDRTIPVLNDKAVDACKNVVNHFGAVSVELTKAKKTANAAVPRPAKIPKLSQGVDVEHLETEILATVKAGLVTII